MTLAVSTHSLNENDVIISGFFWGRGANPPSPPWFAPLINDTYVRSSYVKP